ncbi:PREDICTED: uncharacterized protein LOC104608311 [Nelumbo nucifera]|uniref:Uncharacterized protein LOC104608311 n=1 Tax=Nelumbo nucifera TaxID=4432 RepID=A0A1U8Q8M2_NELNU|nr:PREDICTED: uncharacterized protein LOC104608311 [Nelumbo nucifera]
MQAFTVSPNSHLLLLGVPHSCCSFSLIRSRNPSFFRSLKTITSSPKLPSALKSFADSSNSDSINGDNDDDEDEYENLESSDSEPESISDHGIDIKIEKLGKNSRRIQSCIAIDASLETVWGILTDYERLADFIPGLSVSQLLEKKENFARLFQVGQQNLAFGLKFNAKGIVECFEKDLEDFPCGQRRDIEFNMIEGDFQTFQGKWSIEQTNNERCEGIDSFAEKKICTTLSYVVDVVPKRWLPVRLVEGRLCREIKMNLLCIRIEAEKAVPNTLPTCQ